MTADCPSASSTASIKLHLDLLVCEKVDQFRGRLALFEQRRGFQQVLFKDFLLALRPHPDHVDDDGNAEGVSKLPRDFLIGQDVSQMLGYFVAQIGADLSVTAVGDEYGVYLAWPVEDLLCV